MAKEYSFPADIYLLIGKVGKAHGLKGEISINPFSRQPDNIDHYSHLILVDEDGHLSHPLKIIKSRVARNVSIVQFEGIEDRNQAEQIRSMGVLVNKADLPELEQNEFYCNDLIGLNVQTDEGKQLGKVTNIFSNGAQEVIEIHGNGRHYMIPIIKDVITHQDNNKIIIVPPPGLLDMNNS